MASKRFKKALYLYPYRQNYYNYYTDDTDPEPDGKNLSITQVTEKVVYNDKHKKHIKIRLFL